MTIEMPESLAVGGTVRVRVRGVPSQARMTAQFGDTTYPLMPVSGGAYRLLLGLPVDMEPGDYELRIIQSHPDDPEEYPLTLTIQGRERPRTVLHLKRQKLSLYESPRIAKFRETIRGALRTRSDRQQWRGTFEWPHTGKITSGYGALRRYGGNGPWRFHKGLDIRGRMGDPVVSCAPGRVVLAGRFPLEGKMVILDHGHGVTSIYMHLSVIYVEKNEWVKGGETIGAVGSTGISESPHLHWGVYVHGVPVDPVEWTEFGF